MANPLPSTKPSIGGRVARGALNVGVATFNKMFPTLGRAIGRFTGNTVDDKGQTAQQINAVLVSNNMSLDGINRKLEEQNKILESILNTQRQTSGASRTPSASSEDDFDIPIPDAERRRPRPRSRGNLKWRRFLRFVRRKASVLFARIGAKLATAGALATIPIAGWLAAAISMGLLVSDAYAVYSLWQEFNALPENEQAEGDEEDEDEDDQEDQTRIEREREAVRENLGDVSQMGETQNLNPQEQQVLNQQEAESERRRQSAGLTENLEDPQRQRLMTDLAAARETLRRANTPLNRRRVSEIEKQLENYTARNPVSEADATRIRPTEPPREERSAAPSAQPQTPATPRGSIGTFMDEEASFTPPPMPQPQQQQPVEPSTRISAESFSGEYDKITFEADKITFQGAINQIRQQQGIPLSSREAEVVRASLPPPSAGFRTAQFRDRIPESPDQVTSSLATRTASYAPSTTAASPSASQAAPAPAAMPGASRSFSAVSGSGAAAMQFFISKGWTPAQAAGFAANLQVESNFNPSAVGDSGRAYGIAQWHPDRQRNFQAWSGKDIRGSTFEEQLGFIHHELTQGSEKRAGERIRQATTPEQAAAVIDQYYERSNGHARQRRVQLATNYASTNPATPGNQMAQAPSANPAMLAEASTQRVAADREQARTNQRIIAGFNQQSSTGVERRQSAERSRDEQPQIASGEVPLRARILNVFNQLDQAS